MAPRLMMESFVRLRLHDMRRGEEVERWFNLRYVRSFDVERNEVMLQGSHSAIKVTDDSMERLLSFAREGGCSGMCRDLCAYDFAFSNIIGYLDGRFSDGGSSYRPAILDGIASSESVNDNIRCICKRAFVLVEENERLKRELSEITKGHAGESFMSRIKKFFCL